METDSPKGKYKYNYVEVIKHYMKHGKNSNDNTVQHTPVNKEIKSVEIYELRPRVKSK